MEQSKHEPRLKGADGRVVSISNRFRSPELRFSSCSGSSLSSSHQFLGTASCQDQFVSVEILLHSVCSAAAKSVLICPSGGTSALERRHYLGLPASRVGWLVILWTDLATRPLGRLRSPHYCTQRFPRLLA